MSTLNQRLSRIEEAIRRPSGPSIDQAILSKCIQDHLVALSDAQLDRFEQLMIKVGADDPDAKHQPLTYFAARFDPQEIREIETFLEAMRFDCRDRHPQWCDLRSDV